MRNIKSIILFSIILLLFSCSRKPVPQKGVIYYKDFDAFTLELKSPVENPDDLISLFSLIEDNDTIFSVEFYSKNRKRLFQYPQGNYVLEVKNKIGREMPRYGFLKKIDSCYYKIAYDSHPNTFNSTYHSDEVLLNEIIPSFIQKITKDTLFYYSIDEQFFPYSYGNYENEGINSKIPLDSIIHRRMLPFHFNIDTFLIGKTPFFKIYYTNEGVKIRERQNGEIHTEKHNDKENHDLWRNFHNTSWL